jgi:Carbohydrate binding domain (family 11)
VPGRLRAAACILAGAAAASQGCIDETKTATCPAPPGTRAPRSCAAGTRVPDDGAIDDFEDGDNQLAKVADRGGYWFTSHDPNGSTIEPSPFKMSEGGFGNSQRALHVSGQTASSDGAWGSLWGAQFVGQGVYDGSKYDGISFRAKLGPNGTPKVRFKVADINTHPDGGVCKSCWNHFGKNLQLTQDWQEYKVSFAEMTQEPGWGDRYAMITPSKLIAINWSVDPGRTFDVWIDDVQFYECQ